MAKIRCDIYRGEKHTVDSCVRDRFGQCVFAGDSYSKLYRNFALMYVLISFALFRGFNAV